MSSAEVAWAWPWWTVMVLINAVNLGLCVVVTRVFEAEVYVDTNGLTGRLLVVPLSGRVRRELDRRRSHREQ